MITDSTNVKMNVEIWSDVVCPFCYMAKRKFEAALSGFKDVSNIEIIWRSFQLAPGAKSEPDKSFYQALSEHSGMSMEQSKTACDQVTQAAAQMGLIYDFDKAISANTFNAHRFSHFAKSKGLQNDAEEGLLKAYFTSGKNIDDVSTLVELGMAIGLDGEETKAVLESSDYADEVREDIRVAQQTGVIAVPFFRFNGKHSLSGVQDTRTFSKALEDAYAGWLNDRRHTETELTIGRSCTIDGFCQ
jgi:predicted DsbA family dithiol-disulfide isomerase